METIQKHFFLDLSVMLGRSMRHIFRSMDTIITVTIMPIAMMLLFVYVFGGAIQTGTGKYVNYILPGILLIALASAISVVVIMLVALMMGFRSSAGILSWLTIAGILALFTLALTWVAVIPGLTAKSADGAAAFSYPLIFLPFISSAFVPTRSMPPVVRAFAENQPVTAIVETIRALLAGQPVSQEIWVALAWCVGILVVAYIFAMRAYQKRV